MSELITIGRAGEVAEGEMRAYEVAGHRVAVARVADTLHAFGDTCTHRQCSLAQGDLDGTVVTCPCHGSRFEATTGEVLAGPAQDPVPSYRVQVTGDELQVEV
ncbi:MAG: Rieske (2Fe-2S) protein [Acidimicrobiia bacterium]